MRSLDFNGKSKRNNFVVPSLKLKLKNQFRFSTSQRPTILVGPFIDITLLHLALQVVPVTYTTAALLLERWSVNSYTSDIPCLSGPLLLTVTRFSHAESDVPGEQSCLTRSYGVVVAAL